MSQPNLQQRYITPDGRLTQEGILMFQDWLRRMKQLEETVADHEARIIILEP